MKFTFAILLVLVCCLLAGCARPVAPPNVTFKFCDVNQLTTTEEQRLAQAEFDAGRATIDSFRRCRLLIVQQEYESWAAFAKRIGNPGDFSCLIARKATQNPGASVASFFDGRSNMTIFGGTFDGHLQEEKP
jgi:hypothetical protein